MLILLVNQMGLEVKDKEMTGRKKKYRTTDLGLEVKDKEMNRRKKKYPTTDLGLEVKDMVGDCKIVLQSVQKEGRLIIMMTMRTEHMKCYHDDDEGVDDVLLCIMMND